MPDDRTLRPATHEEIRDTLAYALRYDGRRPHRHAVHDMARIAAEVLVAHLERSGFVVMKRPDAQNTTPLKPGGLG